MRNLLVQLYSASNAKLDLALAAFVVMAFVLGCGGGSSSTAPKKAIPASYLGTWTGADGTTISIRNDNTGDYKAGSSNVNGAAVEVDETGKEIKFTMLGVEVGKYKIDKTPSGNSMTLDGMVYKKSGGGSMPSSDSETKTSPSDVSSSDIPDEDGLNTLVGETMENFNSAIQSGDFNDFHSQISEAWQAQITPEKLAETFGVFTKQKVDLTPKAGSRPIYSPKPSLDENKMLVVNGSYQSVKNKNTQFKLTYAKEGSDWKLFGIRVVP